MISIKYQYDFPLPPLRAYASSIGRNHNIESSSKHAECRVWSAVLSGVLPKPSHDIISAMNYDSSHVLTFMYVSIYCESSAAKIYLSIVFEYHVPFQSILSSNSALFLLLLLASKMTPLPTTPTTTGTPSTQYPTLCSIVLSESGILPAWSRKL